jgi:two-component system LytT family sensor kinase
VENAIRHGVSQSAEAGYVRVRGEVRGEELRITIENNGGETAAATGPGVGLQNVRRRLEICYGPAAGISLTPAPDKTMVEIRFPLSSVHHG